MRNSFFRGAVIALVLALLCSAALAEVRTTADVWMRSGPGLNYDEVTSIKEGKSLTYEGETSVDERGVAWYKVTSGKNTGWVSSKYTELVGETAAPAATAEPAEEAEATPAATAEPAEEAEAEPTQLPAVDVGLLFTNSVAEDEAGDEAEPTAAPEPAAPRVVELSVYYLDDLVSTANEIGLISYRQVESDVPYQYYDDAVIVAGNQLVENIVVYGEGYEVYGVRVGMSLNAAMACMNVAGLDYRDSETGAAFLHKAAEDSPYNDGQGYDSVIRLWIDENDTVTQIDWATEKK